MRLTVAAAILFAALAATASAGTVPTIVNPTTRPIVAKAVSPTASLIRLTIDPAGASSATAEEPNRRACWLLIARVQHYADGTARLLDPVQMFRLTATQTSWTGGATIRPGGPDRMVQLLVSTDPACQTLTGGSASLLKIPAFRK